MSGAMRLLTYGYHTIDSRLSMTSNTCNLHVFHSGGDYICGVRVGVSKAALLRDECALQTQQHVNLMTGKLLYSVHAPQTDSRGMGPL